MPRSRAFLSSKPAQLEALDLAGFRTRQVAHELDGARIFVGCDLGLHELLEFFGGRFAGLRRIAQDHEGLDDPAALLVGHADHRAFLDFRMVKQRILDLRAADVVAGGNDHVVGPRDIPEIAVGILAVTVARQIPAVDDVAALPLLVVEVFAAGRPPCREQAFAGRLQDVAGLVHNTGLVAGDRRAGRAGPDVVALGRNENVDHFRRAQAIDDPDPGCGPECLEGRQGQRFAGGNALFQGCGRGFRLPRSCRRARDTWSAPYRASCSGISSIRSSRRSGPGGPG